MSQEATNFHEEGIDEPPVPVFPKALLEPPAWWCPTGHFDAGEFDDVAEEMAYQLGWDDDGIVPKAGLRRFELHGNVGQFGIYVHQLGRLFAADFVAIEATSTPGTFLGVDPLAEPVPTFTRLSGALGIVPTISAAAVEAIARLPQDEIENGAPSATLDPEHQQPSRYPK